MILYCLSDFINRNMLGSISMSDIFPYTEIIFLNDVKGGMVKNTKLVALRVIPANLERIFFNFYFKYLHRYRYQLSFLQVSAKVTALYGVIKYFTRGVLTVFAPFFNGGNR
ncbi:MAG: hypothetical protein JWQ84_2701 [Mucilaginibacter sp.]|nr:hypothetical protein [Mucilaginibacter sp.]